uniref:KRAB domain-containing protein n=1 Tax=Laticauda laticaudata TaxID=8630 RepID=A0A8C5WV39_LATLA
MELFFLQFLLDLLFSCQEGLVSYKEVAVHFSEEEWSQLDPDQKVLHWEVMLENYSNVASLGKGLSYSPISSERHFVIIGRAL